MKRTNQQNKALHKYFQEEALDCVEKGRTVAIIIRALKTWGTCPSADVLKSMFQAVCLSKFGKEHTSDLTTKELSEVGEDFVNIMASLGSEVRFPSREELEFDNYYSKSYPQEK